MIKVLFICHGNICRSPMAELLFKEYVKEKGKEKYFLIDSAATSLEEIGNPVHYGTRKILDSLNIDYSHNRAKQITLDMYKSFDYIIIMDEYNRYNITRRLGNAYSDKVHRLLDYTNNPKDIADPWYTGDFNLTYKEIKIGLEAFYKYLDESGLIGE
jgi:protein-tyrosine phosphatase